MNVTLNKNDIIMFLSGIWSLQNNVYKQSFLEKWIFILTKALIDMYMVALQPY